MSQSRLSRWSSELRTDGLRRFATKHLRAAYLHRIRRMTPRVPVRYAGIIGPLDRHIGDTLMSGLIPQLRERIDRPRYEEGLIRALGQHVRAGDRVVVVGGGYGITAAFAARRAGPDGSIVCYEGSPEQASLIAGTAARNGVRIDVRTAVVGVARYIYGDNPTGNILAAAELPPCDVLELDCEGAEVIILREMTIRPRVVIVETHGVFGSPSAEVRRQLVDLGYGVTDFGLAESDYAHVCMKDDIRILVGATTAG